MASIFAEDDHLPRAKFKFTGKSSSSQQNVFNKPLPWHNDVAYDLAKNEGSDTGELLDKLCQFIIMTNQPFSVSHE